MLATPSTVSPLSLRGAALFANLSREIENRLDDLPDEDVRSDHRAFVVAAVMQSCAGLQSEITDLVAHGPGYHLGSNGIDTRARDFLQPLKELFDARPVLEQYQLVLHLLGKNRFHRGKQPFQWAELLVNLDLSRACLHDGEHRKALVSD